MESAYGKILRLLHTDPLRTFKDEYGIEETPPGPLDFDSVNENKPSASEAPMFKIPVEILAMIVERVRESSLATLASVSRDCRQLARSRQFARIILDYSPYSIALVDKLVAEREIRLSYAGCSSISQSLGVCIRSIIVATSPFKVAARHGIPFGHHSMQLDARTWNHRLAEADDSFFGHYLKNIQLLLSSKLVLPNLETLDWRDNTVLPRSFFKESPFPNIQHLRLYRVRIGETLGINHSQGLKLWSLRTLVLNIIPDPGVDRPTTSLTCANMLRLCASTLESLTWGDIKNGDEENHSFATNMMGLAPQFPRLRSLSLYSVPFSDYSMLDALLESRLCEIQVDLARDALYSEFFEERGTMPTLTTLVWNGKIERRPSLRFLQTNTHLSKLSLAQPTPGAFLEVDLLPLLRTWFRQLTSLSLDWAEDSISSSALEAIGALKSLEQLHLSAGELPQGRNAWVIDHELIRSRLKNLASLRRLAFCRDVYDNGFELSPPARYYELRGVFNGRCGLTAHEWETLHARAMLTEAETYATAMPSLEWVYFGQLFTSLRVIENLQGGRPGVLVLSRQREKLANFLWQLFGFKNI